MSIFVVEHERDGAWQVETVICEDLDTSQYQPIQKIFVCEDMGEARASPLLPAMVVMQPYLKATSQDS